MHQTRQKTFEFYFQILKNLKLDLILGLNFQRTFKISQDITDDNNLYLHIRRKIVTFSQQAKNTTNHIKKKNSQFIAINSIPSPQTVLTMYNKLTMVMLPAGVKNSQDYDSCDFLSCSSLYQYFFKTLSERSVFLLCHIDHGFAGVEFT